jgi:hypothetical protein
MYLRLMGVPTLEVNYTTAMPRREDHEVHKDKKKKKKKEKKKKNLQCTGCVSDESSPSYSTHNCRTTPYQMAAATC